MRPGPEKKQRRQPRPALRLVYVYCREDERLREGLERHLAPFRMGGLLETWHDRLILPGEDWGTVVDEHLREADVVAALVSSYLIASAYWYGVELACAMERHLTGAARLVPIIVRPTYWELLPLGGLQVLPRDGKAVTLWENRDSAWLDVTRGIKQVIDEHVGGEAPQARPAPRRPPSGSAVHRP